MSTDLSSTSGFPDFSLPAMAQPARRATPTLAIALSLAGFAALWFAGQGTLLRIAIPSVATLLGLRFYLRQPVLYVQFTLWVWFLAPLMRRIVDVRFGFEDPNIVMLAPFLVAGISILNLVPPFRRDGTRIPVAFVLCGVAILYGFAIGILTDPSAGTLFGLLNWICPLLAGFFVYSNWPLYEEFRSAIGRTFVWAVLILGAYGLYQFFFTPSWDLYWLDHVWTTSTSFGYPAPMQVRIWSTLNSPGPFANVMMAGLVLSFVVGTSIKLPAGIAGYLSLLLSAVRTAWLSWAVGVLFLLGSINRRLMMRAVLTFIVIVAIVVPISQDSRVASLMGDRFKSFVDLRSDESFGARLAMYEVLFQETAHNPFGIGLNNIEVSHGMAVDSGILAMLFSLGWLGSGLFAAGIVCLLIQKNKGRDEFWSASRAIILAILAQIVGGNIFVGVTGAVVWMFAGMLLAGSLYHEKQIQSMENLELQPGTGA